jgi:membrane dipeptidase
MMALHEECIVIDGLEICRWDRSVFEAMHSAGLTAVNCTCSVWENFQETMENVSELRRLLAQHHDIIRQVYVADDIRAAKAEGRVGIILGWQNTSAIEDRIHYLELFKQLGIGIVQLTYNTQNWVGSGCFESRDGGLSDFGHDVVSEMNRVGMLIDLSHVGARTAKDVIKASQKPVAFTHTCPAALKPHVRNKSDDEMRAVALQGGLVGVTLLPWFLKAGDGASIEDYVDAVEHVVGVVGEDHAGIGTDFIEGQDEVFLEWLLRDKGHGRFLTEEPVAAFRDAKMPKGLERIADFPNLTAALERRKWPEARIRKILGENWLRVLEDVWAA